MSNLQTRIAEWQAEVFGESQTIHGIDCHLTRELKELLDAPNFENETEEIADMLILLLGRAHKMGIDLQEATRVGLEQRNPDLFQANTLEGKNAYAVTRQMTIELNGLLTASSMRAQAQRCSNLLILLMVRADQMGIDILIEGEKKLAINKTRTWNKPDAQGVISHVR